VIPFGSGRVLDSTALLAIAGGTSDYADALLAVATELGLTLAVPAASLLAAWQQVSPGDRVWLAGLTDAATVVVVNLDADDARDAGLLAAASGLDNVGADAAHAALTGLRRAWSVVTKVPGDVGALSPEVRTETIP
jgi:hypothetical protein